MAELWLAEYVGKEMIFRFCDEPSKKYRGILAESGRIFQELVVEDYRFCISWEDMRLVSPGPPPEVKLRVPFDWQKIAQSGGGP